MSKLYIYSNNIFLFKYVFIYKYCTIGLNFKTYTSSSGLYAQAAATDKGLIVGYLCCRPFMPFSLVLSNIYIKLFINNVNCKWCYIVCSLNVSNTFMENR